jgi:hypothetical protein
MQYMVVELFKGGDPRPTYKRFAEQGRLAPEGVRYLSSWVDLELSRCFQLMETSSFSLLEQWMSRWSDLVDFQVFPVISSAEAAERVLKFA